jgi:hypothetical protein
MKFKHFFPVCIFVLFLSTTAESQVIVMGRPPRYRMRPPRQKSRAQQLPKFQPSVDISAGYGFPNGDKDYIPTYYNAYNGSVSQTGPFAGSIDYHFQRNMSIGVLVTHGMLKAPYYAYGNTSGVPDFNFNASSWAVMLDILHYIGATKNVTPYTRVALGFNIWDQNYTDAAGDKVSMPSADLPDFAYQLSLGAKFRLSKNSSLFLEAGYGKYIVNGGLSFKF